MAAPSVDEFARRMGADASDVDLVAQLARAVAYVERHAGPFEATAFTAEGHAAGGGWLRVPVPRLLSVSEVADGDGATVAHGRVLPRSGRVELLAAGAGAGAPYTVSGSHGWDGDDPSDLAEAVFMLGEHWWRQRRGRASRSAAAGGAIYDGYAVPAAAAELLRDLAGPAVA